MDEETLLLEVETAMEEAVEHMQAGFAGVRTGKASPSLVDNMDIFVASYGSSMKLKSLAVVSTPDARSILIQPFDPGTLNDIKKAIAESRLGISPIIDARSVRLPIPELSQERRTALAKQAKAETEDAKVALRNIRRDGNESAKKAEKDGALTEDDLKKMLDDIQKMTDRYIASLDAMLGAKEKELMTM